MTLDGPLTVRRAPNGYLYVNGTPTDCVHLAVTGLLEKMPDMIISGINLGANMGDDTIYSGTVAAATEGFLLGLPSIAVSLVTEHGARGEEHFETAAEVVAQLVERFQRQPASAPWLLNVNVPNVAAAQLQGWQVTRLGKRHKAEPVIQQKSPRGETIYWVGAAGPAADAGEGTDFAAIAAGQVSITPLQMDLTYYSEQRAVEAWLRR